MKKIVLITLICWLTGVFAAMAVDPFQPGGPWAPSTPEDANNGSPEDEGPANAPIGEGFFLAAAAAAGYGILRKKKRSKV